MTDTDATRDMTPVETTAWERDQLLLGALPLEFQPEVKRVLRERDQALGLLADRLGKIDAAVELALERAVREGSVLAADLESISRLVQVGA